MIRQEQEALVSIAVLAAQADGLQVESERAEVEAVASSLSSALPGPIERSRLPELARAMRSPASRRRAFETAVAVCNSDGILSAREREFLGELARGLGLLPEQEAQVEQEGDALARAAVTGEAPVDESQLQELILRTSILCGGLEFLPQGISTLAILPLQMRMVYRIGKQHGFELDRAHLADFLATVGLGMTSQYLEGFARRVVGGLASRVGGGFLRSLAAPSTGAVFTFASTHALGQIAKRYYEGGRSLSGAELRQAFKSIVEESRALGESYSGQMRRSASGVKLSRLSSLLEGT